MGIPILRPFISGVFIAKDVRDIRTNGLNAENGVSLAGDALGLAAVWCSPLRAAPAGVWIGKQIDKRTHASDKLAGVIGTTHTARGAKLFGQANEIELTIAAVCQPGMNSDVRRAILKRRQDEITAFVAKLSQGQI